MVLGGAWHKTLGSLALVSLLGCSKRATSSDPTPITSAPTAPAKPAGSAPAATVPSSPAAPAESAEPTASAPDEAEPPSALVAKPGGLAAGERVPLLVFLHGLGASAEVAFRVLKLEDFAERHRTFVVAPNGEFDSKRRRFWNAHPACCNFDDKPIDDVARLRALIHQHARRPEVDPQRLFVMGHSNGGFMTLRLACEMGDELAAVASIAGSGSHQGETCRLKKPLYVLQAHGDKDDIVRYPGGSVFDGPTPRHESAAETVAGWAKKLGCSGQPKSRPAMDLSDKLAGAETNVSTYQCPNGGAELWTVAGGNHFIGSNPTLMDRVWQFLSSHPKG